MTPNRSARRGQIQPLVAVALGVVAIVGIVAAVLVARPAPAAAPAPVPSASPSAPAAPTPQPSAAPATPSPIPTAAPSTDPLAFKLESATNQDVSVKVQNPDGVLTGARSGQPGDGMSVRWHDALVKNVDADTIEVTFAGLPLDETVDLVVTADGGKIHLTIVQMGPVAQSDAMGEDRVVVLSFDNAVKAANVSVEILDRTID